MEQLEADQKEVKVKEVKYFEIYDKIPESVRHKSIPRPSYPEIIEAKPSPKRRYSLDMGQEEKDIIWKAT